MTFKDLILRKSLPFITGLMILTIPISLDSCKQKEDVEFPVIQFLKPYESAFYSVGDTIPIQAEISDNNAIEFIDITLTDENFNPVLKTYNPPFNSNPFTLVFDYPINDNFLESGIYNLLIRAGDGTQIKNKYQRIYIGALPKTNVGIAYSIGNSPFSSVGVYHLWPALQNSPYNLNASNTFQLAAIPYQNILAVASLNNGKIVLYNYLTGDSITFLKDISLVDKSLSGIKGSAKALYLFFDNGLNHRYTYLGFKNLVFESPNFTTTNLIDFDDLIVTTCKKTTYPFQERIQTFQNTTGAALNSYYIDFKAVRLFRMNNSILVFGLKNQQITAHEYFPNQNQLSSLKTLGSFDFRGSCQIDNELFLILTNNQVLLFNTKTRTSSTFLNNITGNQIEFDPVNNIIFITENHNIYMYSYPTKTLTGQIGLEINKSINQIIPLYNR